MNDSFVTPPELCEILDAVAPPSSQQITVPILNNNEQIPRATDREIDRHVYQLYGLSGDEIKIVEEATK